MNNKNIFLLLKRSGKNSDKNLTIKENLITKVCFINLFLAITISYSLNLISIFYVKNYINSEKYEFILNFLKISFTDFNKLLETHYYYSVITIIIAFIIAYIAPHILASMIFLFTKSFNENINYDNIMKISKLSLIFAFYYIIPVVGPYISFYIIAKNLFYLIKDYIPNISNFLNILIVLVSLYTTIFTVNMLRYVVYENLYLFK